MTSRQTPFCKRAAPTGEVELVVNERGDSLRVFHAYPT